jgi:glutathione synthase/RimK-type ligase-like ATP-grasp enzyme
MRFGIHVDPDGNADKSILKFETILAHNGIEYVWLDANQPDFWQQVEKLDLFIFNWYWTSLQHQMAPTLLRVIENQMKIKCFPNFKTWWMYDDKIREYYLLHHHGFPAVPTSVFWQKDSAYQWLETAELPVVFKLKSGAGSENVVLVKTKAHAEKLIDKMFGKGIVSGRVPGTFDLRLNDLGLYKTLRRYFGDQLRSIQLKDISPFEQRHKNYVLFQKYLRGNTFDLRVTTIGNRIFGSKRFIRENDFRASGGGRSSWDKEDLDLRCHNIAYAVSSKLGFQTMSYDFLFDEQEQPCIGEISYACPDWSVWMSPGYHDKNLNWHEGHFWPQYCVLMDLLNLPDLKQPEMRR